MALQTSGAISLNQIHVEAGGGSGTQASINDSDIRGLISKGSGAQNSFSEYYGASSGPAYTDLLTMTAGFLHPPKFDPDIGYRAGVSGGTPIGSISTNILSFLPSGYILEGVYDTGLFSAFNISFYGPNYLPQSTLPNFEIFQGSNMIASLAPSSFTFDNSSYTGDGFKFTRYIYNPGYLGLVDGQTYSVGFL